MESPRKQRKRRATGLPITAGKHVQGGRWWCQRMAAVYERRMALAAAETATAGIPAPILPKMYGELFGRAQ